MNDDDDASLHTRDPSRQSLNCRWEGSKVVLPPLAIVWRCPLAVEQYVAEGRQIEVQRPGCLDCDAPLRFRSGYWRHVRSGGGTGRRIWIRRAECPPCRRSHALLPSFLLQGRLDVVRNDEYGNRSSLGGFAARLVAQCGPVGGAQLIVRTRCVGVGARDAEVELAQFVDHRRHELGAPVAKQFGADP